MHDFKRFPELTLKEAQIYYFMSPHKQIFDSFTGRCVKVHDGDTISVRWSERDFDFPVRFRDVAAPELSENGGKEAQRWVTQRILNEDIFIHIDPNNKVEKWGRLLGKIYHDGVEIGHLETLETESTPWDRRKDGKILGIQNPITEFEKQWG